MTTLLFKKPPFGLHQISVHIGQLMNFLPAFQYRAFFVSDLAQTNPPQKQGGISL
jgi:hypothetical protein